MSNIMRRISDNYDEMTNSMKEIADFIANNYNIITYDNLERLSEKIGVSTASIMRFSKFLGYSGYTDMQEGLRRYAESYDPHNLSQRFDSMYESDYRDNLFRDTLDRDMQNIFNTLNSLTESYLSNVIKHISEARRVYITGFNDSFTLAYYMSLRLGEIRKRVHLLQPVGGMYPMQVSGANEEDLLIAYLFPNYSQNTVDTINWLKKKNTKVLIITNQNLDRIDELGDMVIPCYIDGISIKESLIAPMSVSNYLANAVALCDYDQSMAVLKDIETILQSGHYFGDKDKNKK